MELNLSFEALLSAVMLVLFGAILLLPLRVVFYRWVAWSLLWAIGTPMAHGASAIVDLFIMAVLFTLLEVLYRMTSKSSISKGEST